jgi:hypothetical protein
MHRPQAAELNGRDTFLRIALNVSKTQDSQSSVADRLNHIIGHEHFHIARSEKNLAAGTNVQIAETLLR